MQDYEGEVSKTHRAVRGRFERLKIALRTLSSALRQLQTRLKTSDYDHFALGELLVEHWQGSLKVSPKTSPRTRMYRGIVRFEGAN